MILLEQEYDSESIIDIERDVYEAVNYAELPTDEHGFVIGTFKVKLEWSEE